LRERREPPSASHVRSFAAGGPLALRSGANHRGARPNASHDHDDVRPTLDARMEKALTVRPYPWERLEQVPRELPGALRDARRAPFTALETAKLDVGLAEMLGVAVQLMPASVETVTQDARRWDGSVVVSLGSSDETFRIELELEAELARTLVSAVIGR